MTAFLRAALAAFALMCALVLAAPAPAATIELTDQTWTCTQPLANYGPPPLTVVLHFTTTNVVDFGVRLGSGCHGRGNPDGDVDLILNVEGDGDVGMFDDAIRVMNASPGASDIVISGKADCGRARSGAHQDGIHAIGGTNITFRDFELGLNGPGGNPSCMGAGGALFYSDSGEVVPVNMDVEGGTFAGCNHGLIDAETTRSADPTGHIEGATFLSGYDSAHPTACRDNTGRQFVQSNACFTANPGVTEHDLRCYRWPDRPSAPAPPTPSPEPAGCDAVCESDYQARIGQLESDLAAARADLESVRASLQAEIDRLAGIIARAAQELAGA